MNATQLEQIRPIGGSNYELASLHVVDSYRKRGLGSQLVRQLVKEFASEHGPEQVSGGGQGTSV